MAIGRPKTYETRVKIALPGVLVTRCETVRELRCGRLHFDPPTADLYREAIALGLVEMERVERGGDLPAPLPPAVEALPAAAPVPAILEDLRETLGELVSLAGETGALARLEGVAARLEAAAVSAEALRAVFLSTATPRPYAPTPGVLPVAPPSDPRQTTIPGCESPAPVEPVPEAAPTLTSADAGEWVRPRSEPSTPGHPDIHLSQADVGKWVRPRSDPHAEAHLLEGWWPLEVAHYECGGCGEPLGLDLAEGGPRCKVCQAVAKTGSKKLRPRVVGNRRGPPAERRGEPREEPGRRDGDRVRALREARGLTAKAAAALAGCAQSTWSRYESGPTQTMPRAVRELVATWDAEAKEVTP